MKSDGERMIEEAEEAAGRGDLLHLHTLVLAAYGSVTRNAAHRDRVQLTAAVATALTDRNVMSMLGFVRAVQAQVVLHDARQEGSAH